MAVIKELNTIDEYQSAVNGKGINVIKFWAEWCMPCKVLNKTIESLSEEEADSVNFYGIDTEKDEFNDVCVDSKVRNLPTLIIYKDGQHVTREVGSIPRNKVIEVLETVKNGN